MHLRGIKLILQELRPYKDAQYEGMDMSVITDSIKQFGAIDERLDQGQNPAQVESDINEIRQKLIEFQKKELNDQAQNELYDTVHLVLLILAKCWPLGNARDEDDNLECPLSKETLTNANCFATSLGSLYSLKLILNHFESNSDYKKCDPISKQPFNKRDLALAKAQANWFSFTSIYEDPYRDAQALRLAAIAQQRDAQDNYRQLKDAHTQQNIARIEKEKALATSIDTVSILLGGFVLGLFIIYVVFPFILPYALTFNSVFPILATSVGIIALPSGGVEGMRWIFNRLLHSIFDDRSPPPQEPVRPLQNDLQARIPPEPIDPAPSAYLKRMMVILKSLGDDTKPEFQPGLESKAVSSSSARMLVKFAHAADAEQPGASEVKADAVPQIEGSPLPFIDPNQQRKAAREPHNAQSMQRLNFLNSLNPDGTKRGSPVAISPSPGSSARVG